MTTIRVSILLLITLTATAGLLVGPLPAQPAGDELKKIVHDIAGQMRKAEKDKSDAKAAKELAAKTGKGIEETTELMAMFKLRDKGGLGVGKPGTVSATRDGIEPLVREMARAVPPAVLKDVAALEDMGYMIAAMGAIVDAKGPPKNADAKGKKLWHEYAHEAHVQGLELAKVAATKDPAKIKMAAYKVNNACGGCHAFFK
jgi:hypothetical protein